MTSFFRDLVSYARSLPGNDRSYTPLMAFAGLILIFAEEPLTWGLRHLSPDLARMLDAMGQGKRILALGVPATFLFLAAMFAPDFLRLRAAGALAPSPLKRSTAAPVMIEEEETQPVQDRLLELRRTEGKIPAAFVGVVEERRGWLPDGERFDANRYFTVFGLLKPDPGRRLDYVFESTGNGGRPLLYMRGESETPLESGQAYRARFPLSHTDLPHLHGLRFEPSPAGYLQATWYAIEAPQFYLHWHAQYARLEVVGTRRRLEQIVAGLPAPELSDADRSRALALDPRPAMRISGSAGEVSLLTFSPWGGFVLATYKIVLPSRLLALSQSVQAGYQSHVRF